jgi:hypothetical protein
MRHNTRRKLITAAADHNAFLLYFCIEHSNTFFGASELVNFQDDTWQAIFANPYPLAAVLVARSGLEALGMVVIVLVIEEAVGTLGVVDVGHRKALSFHEVDQVVVAQVEFESKV